MRSGGINNPPAHNRTLKKKIKIRMSSRGRSLHAFNLRAHLKAYFKSSRALSRIAIKKPVLKLLPRKLKVWYPPLSIVTIILRLVLEKTSSVSLETPLDLFSACFHETITSKLTGIYPKLIHLKNKRTHCTTDHIFKTKLFLTTKNAHISRSAVDIHQFVNYFKLVLAPWWKQIFIR